MFILNLSVDSSKQADEARKLQEAEAKKQKEAEEKQQTETRIANEKKAEELKKQKEAARAKSTAKSKGISGLSNKTQAVNIQKRREVSSESARDQISKSSGNESGKIARESLKNEISNLDKDIANLDPKDPNYANDKAILEKEKAQFRQEEKQLIKSEFNDQQKETNRELKKKYGGIKHYGSDVNLDPGVQKQRARNIEQADRILNEPGYAKQLAYNRNHTSDFGNPAISSWAQDRLRLGEMGKQKGISGGSAGNQLAGGDIDFKNGKGAIRHLGGQTLYAPDKTKPDEVYKVKMQKNDGNDPDIRQANHNIIKQMIDGTLDEKGMQDLGLDPKKTNYKTELAQHKERKEKGILTPEQTERKEKALASAKSRKEALEASLAHANPVQQFKIQGKLDRISSLISKQEEALSKSEGALAKATPEEKTSMGLEETDGLAEADNPKSTEAKEAEKAEKEKDSELTQLSTSLESSIASRDVNGIKAVVSKLTGNDSASDLNSKAQSALDEIKAENKASNVA